MHIDEMKQRGTQLKTTKGGKMAKEPSFRDYMLQLQEKNAMLQKQLKEEEKKHEEIAKKYDALESKIKRRKAIIQMIVVQLLK